MGSALERGRGRSWRALRSASCAALPLLYASVAAADHCHRPPLGAARAQGVDETAPELRFEGRSSFASFELGSQRGTYESLGVGLSFSSGRFSAEAGFPVYRLVRDSETAAGPGDTLLAAALTVFRDKPWRIGVDASATLPSGDADAELGMGHVMLTPSAWAALDLDTHRLSARLGYATVVGEDGGHHHGYGLRPLVSPMNQRELQTSLYFNESLLPSMALELGADLAIATDRGRRYAVASAAATFSEGAFDSLVRFELPLFGDPFEQRVTTALGVRW